ncbi:DUF4399 domain-containing protein [Pseudomonas chlororaphis]|nr:DUF4399 domain-containing protein [Pseudomonas chlororaphis]
MKTLVSRVALATVLLGSSMLAVAADGIPRTAAPKDAKVFIVSPKNGATVDKTFTVKFGMKGLVLKPAGDETPGSGHHHLLVDQKALPDPTLPIPATDTVIHYGKAQTETQLTLTPGKHTLQLVAGDKNHMQFTKTVVSKTITVNVK